MSLTPSHQVGASAVLRRGTGLAIILIVLAAIFVVQNTVRHEIHLLWFTVEAATWLVLIVIFLVGVVTGVLLGRRRRR